MGIKGFNLIHNSNHKEGINIQLLMMWAQRENTNTDIIYPSVTRKHILICLLPKQLTRFGRFEAFRQYSSLMKQQDNGSSLVREPTSSTICLPIQEFIFLTFCIRLNQTLFDQMSTTINWQLEERAALMMCIFFF